MWNKQERFSIRKIKGIVGSVIVGSILVAPYIAEASTFHYIDSSQLSSSEKSKIREGSPDESEDSYVLIYEKSELPNTDLILINNLMRLRSLEGFFYLSNCLKTVCVFKIVS